MFKEYYYKNELTEINKFFGKLPHKHKIFVCGNHEITFEREHVSRTERLLTEGIYLQDSMVTVEGVRIYGSPWTGRRQGSNASGFTAPYGDLYRYWERVPEGVDVLVTHSPPGGVLDQRMGSDSLWEAVINKIRYVNLVTTDITWIIRFGLYLDLVV